MPLILLLLFGLLFLPTVGVALDTPRTQITADQTIQAACNHAAQAAAQQYVPNSLAAGQPLVDAAAAPAKAQSILASDLHLDPSTLSPTGGSALTRAPQLDMQVYNGPSFPYTAAIAPVTLTHPGVVLTIQAPVASVTGQSPTQVTRWCAYQWVPRPNP